MELTRKLQADRIATMPVPFETLIPYGILIAVCPRLPIQFSASSLDRTD